MTGFDGQSLQEALYWASDLNYENNVVDVASTIKACEEVDNDVVATSCADINWLPTNKLCQLFTYQPYTYRIMDGCVY